jgi:hypothetical protein
MKTIIFIFLTIGFTSSTVYSQETTTSLVCSGKYHNFSQNIRDVDINGSVIQLQQSIVKVGVPGFSYSNGELLDYKVLTSSESKISFQYLSDKGIKYFGVINRYTGEVDMTELYDKKMVQMFKGKCSPSKRLF